MAEALHPIIAKKGLTPGTPEAVLAVAEVYVKMKYEEGPNKDNLFGKFMGLNHAAWCACFVSYCFNKAGAGDLVAGIQTKKGYVGCTAGIKGIKKKKYKQIPVAEAQPGDIIFFDWEHDHDPDHTGIVLKNNPKKKTVTCREGNTSRGDGSKSNGGQVAQRDRNYSVVFAVFRPNWKPVKAVAKPAVVTSVVAQPVAEKPKVAAPVVTPVVAEKPVEAKPAPVKMVKPALPSYLKLGVKGDAVKYLQHSLGIKEDGIFGDATHKAVVAFQKQHDLKADGVVGPVTWGKVK